LYAIKCTGKGKEIYRPGQALRVAGVWDSQISRQGAHEAGKVVSPMHLVITCARGWVDLRAMAWTEGLCQWKIPMVTSGIEPATFLFVAPDYPNKMHTEHLIMVNNMITFRHSWH
jgi:hypothetical protein